MKFNVRVYVYTTVDQTVDAVNEDDAYEQAEGIVADLAAQGEFDRDLTVEAQEIVNY